MKRLLFVLCLIGLAGSAVRAEGEGVPVSDRHPDSLEEVSNRARSRLYPGGVDENALEVQRQVYAPARTVIPGKPLPEDAHSESHGE